MTNEKLREVLDSIPNKYFWYNLTTVPATDTKILVKAIGSKSSYGNIRVLIEPVVGKGNCWVSYNKLSLEEIPLGYIQHNLNQHIKFGNEMENKL